MTSEARPRHHTIATYCFGWLLMSAFLSCHSEGVLHIRGKVVSAADTQPLAQADVQVAFDTEGVWEQPCDELRHAERLSSGSDGTFETRSNMYNAACGGCKRGVVCVSHPGYQTARIQFDDCSADFGKYEGQEELKVELSPE
jgi:hypothetical protein